MKKYFYLLIISIVSFLFVSNILFADNNTFYITQSDFDLAFASSETVNGIFYNSSDGFNLTDGNYVLNSDISIDNVYIGLYINNNVSIDLNHHSITLGDDMYYPIYIAGGNLIINGDSQINGSSVNVLKSNFGTDSPYGDMIMQYTDKLSVLMGPSGTLKINGGIYNGAIMNFSGEVTINEGIFYDDKIALSSGGTVIVNAGEFTGLLAGAAFSDCQELEINGGTFNGGLVGIGFQHINSNSLPITSISGGLFKTIDENGIGAIGFINEGMGESEFKNVLNSFPKTGYRYNEDVEYGYATIDGIGNLEFTQKEISAEEESINTYTITQADFDAARESYDATTHIGETVKGITYHNDLDFDGFKFSNGTYTLGSDIEISSVYFAGFYIDNNVTINLNNHNITFDDDMYMPIVIDGGHLIINGEGQINGSRVNYLRNDNVSSGVYNVKEFTNKVSIIVTENGNLKINGGIYNGSIVAFTGEVTINNGTFYDEKVALMSLGDTIINNGQFTGSLAAVAILGTNQLKISGGTFLGNDFGLAFFDYSDLNTSISGGTFKSIGENGYGAIGFNSDEMDEEYFDIICELLLKSGYKYDEIVQYNYSPWNKNEGINSVIYTQKELNVVLLNDNEYKIKTFVTNGTITPGAYVNEGNNFTVSYEANNGYTLKSVIVDGIAVNGYAFISSYLFENIVENHTIEVVFALDQNNNGIPDDEEYFIATSAVNGTITESTYVYEETEFTVSYEANEGYILKSIIVDGEEVDKELYHSSYTFDNDHSNHAIEVIYSLDSNNNGIPDEDELIIISGENQTYEKGKDIVITTNGEVDLFVKLLIDNKEVNKKNYSVKSGSTIITIKSKYLDSLSAGIHTVTFVYQNAEVSTTLKIIDNPYTFDNIYNYCILLAISLLSLVISIFKYRHLYKNN